MIRECTYIGEKVNPILQCEATMTFRRRFVLVKVWECCQLPCRESFTVELTWTVYKSHESFTPIYMLPERK